MYNHITFFSDLNEDEIRMVKSVSRRKTYAKNTIVITEGDRSDTLYIRPLSKVAGYPFVIWNHKALKMYF